MTDRTTENNLIVQRIAEDVISKLNGARFADIRVEIRVQDGAVTFVEIGRTDKYKTTEIAGGEHHESPRR